MVDWTDTQTFWLNVTNAALGVLTLALLLALLGSLAKEVFHRLKVGHHHPHPRH